MYAEIARDPDQREFLYKALDALKISYAVSDAELERIPRSGPAIIVANHPFGGIEGMILAAMLRSVRPDVKIMANFMLQRIKEISHLFIFVDPFGQSTSPQKNIRPIRETVKWVNDGGIVGIFPAGTVSHMHWDERQVRDPEWSTTIARVIRKTQAPVLPVFFEGSNGKLFQLLGLFHPLLRTAMLPSELLNKRNTQMRVRVGTPIHYTKLASFENDVDMMAYLRLRSYLLDKSGSAETRKARRIFARMSPPPRVAPVIEPVATELMERELDALAPKQQLLESGEFKVFYAWAPQIPNILREIGRLREVTFRQVGEGTGREIDLDEFDRYYIQLFLWDSAKKTVVGAYRLGRTDEILSKYGKRGLYTSTLFAYKSELLEQLGPAIELGRSFVREENQRSYAPLLLLWKGIGKFVTLDKRYKYLFGPVSISNSYDSLSRQLIATFLNANRFLPELAKLIKPRNPLRHRPLKGWDPMTTSRVVCDIDEVSSLVGEIEANQRGIPVLLRQYLKLGGKLLGFNVDPDFGECLDGLLLVDLTQTERKILDRYMGKEVADEFLAYHAAGSDVSASCLPDCAECA